MGQAATIVADAFGDLWAWLTRTMAPAPEPQRVEPVAPAPPAPPPVGEFDVDEPTLVDEIPAFTDAHVLEEAVPAGDLELADALAPLVIEHAMARLPEPTALPTLAKRALARPTLTFEEAVEIGHDDIAIGAALLKAANSPIYYGCMPLDDVGRAVLRLGARNASQIVTGVAARALFDVDARAEYNLFAIRFNRLFLYAMTSAMTAEKLVTRVAGRGSLALDQLAFSGGLFHDIGKMVALRALASLVLRGAIAQPSERVVVRVLEAVHVRLGAALHARWSLSDELLRICACHHVPELPVDRDHLVIHAVRVASGLNALRVEPELHGAILPEVRQSVRALRLDRVDLLSLDQQLVETARYVTEAFG